MVACRKVSLAKELSRMAQMSAFGGIGILKKQPRESSDLAIWFFMGPENYPSHRARLGVLRKKYLASDFSVTARNSCRSRTAQLSAEDWRCLEFVIRSNSLISEIAGTILFLKSSQLIGFTSPVTERGAITTSHNRTRCDLVRER